MTQLKLVKNLLTSRKIREKAGNLKGKIRYLDLRNPIIRSEKSNQLEKILNGFNGFAGFISGLIFKGLDLGANFVTRALSWLQTSAIRISTFNWNASDKELEALIKAEQTRAFSSVGAFLGRLFGFVVTLGLGYGVSLVVPVVGGKALAARVAEKVISEGGGEVVQSFASAAGQVLGSISNQALISSYINIRKIMNGGKATEGGVDMSFSARFERKLESIKDDRWRSLFESASDEFIDTFWENGMIIAQEIDAAYAQAKLANEASKGKKRTVRLRPNKNLNEELVITGTQSEVETETLAALNNYRLIANRDVGQIVGMPADDFVSAKPLRRQLIIIFKTKKEPPWRMPDGKQSRNKTVTIPDAIVGLTWGKIKFAARPYTWGKFRATAHLDNGRQMAVYGASKSEAEKTLRRMLTLTTANLLNLNVTEEVEKKNLNLKKDSVTVYPAHATLLIRRTTTGEGRSFTDGTKASEDRIRIDLWPNEAPQGLPPLN
jgi:hypothetical protein